MREGAPKPKKESGSRAHSEGSEKHELMLALDMLRDAQKSLQHQMTESGHTYEVEESQRSISLQADAENFAPMLAHLEALLAKANALADSQNRTHHLGVVVRGMHKVDVMINQIRPQSERK